MRFEVNGQSYMLSFNNDDGRWYLITAGADGRMKAIPVISDEFGFVAARRHSRWATAARQVLISYREFNLKKYIFLDTNVFLHFPQLSDIDWLSLATCSEAVLVVSPITLRELNKHKDASLRRKIKQRAASALTVLAGYSEATPPIIVRDRTELQFRTRDPLIEFADFQLNRDVPDDWLLATAIEFAQETNLPRDCVLVSSNDLGLTLKARSQQLIAPLVMPGNLRLPDQLDAEEQRSKELEEENRLLRNALPDLSVSFADGQPFSRVTRRELVEIDEGKLTAILNEARSAYPFLAVSQSSMAPSMFASFMGGQYRTEYNQDLVEYFRELEDSYRKTAEVENWIRSTHVMELILTNSGAAPADDVDVEVHFPDGFEVISDEDLPEFPKKPTPPIKPEDRFARAVAPAFRAPSIPSFDLPKPRPNIRIASIRKTGSYTVDFRIDRIKHTKSRALPTLYLHFSSPESMNSFNFQYNIVAANHPRVATGILNLVFED